MSNSGTTVSYTPTPTFIDTGHCIYTITSAQGASTAAATTVTIDAGIQINSTGETLHTPIVYHQRKQLGNSSCVQER